MPDPCVRWEPGDEDFADARRAAIESRHRLAAEMVVSWSAADAERQRRLESERAALAARQAYRERMAHLVVPWVSVAVVVVAVVAYLWLAL